MATIDAAPGSRVMAPIIPTKLINAEVMKAIEEDLDPYERLCCLFFLIEDYRSGYEQLIESLNTERYTILKWIQDQNVSDWPEKVMEALCLMQNHQILLNLGIVPENAQTMFLTKVLEPTYKINKYAKVFYCLFENLEKCDAQELLDRIYRDIPRPNCETWPEMASLELHLLWWIHTGLVSVSGDRWVLKKLLLILKELNMSGYITYQTLKDYDTQDNNSSPCRYDNQAHGICNLITSMSGDSDAMKRSVSDEKYEISKGLVVIFNEMNFTGPINYERREGSREDCQRILETFKTIFGFDTEVHNDLRQTEIYSALDDLSSRANDYDCFVVFILSHGTYNNVVTSDELECPIEMIQSKFCSEAMESKPKVLVIQACQKQALTTDGLSSVQHNVGRFLNFVQLNSTILGELSIRDPQNGTWYIQILCEVLAELGRNGRTIEDCSKEVTRRLAVKTAPINGKSMKQVSSHSSTLLKKLVFPCRTGVISG